MESKQLAGVLHYYLTFGTVIQIGIASFAWKVVHVDAGIAGCVNNILDTCKAKRFQIYSYLEVTKNLPDLKSCTILPRGTSA